MADEPTNPSTPIEPTTPPVIPAGEPTVPTDPLIDPLATPQAEPIEPTEPIVPQEHWLPEDLRGHERLKDFESPEALARAFAAAELVQALPESYQLPEGQPEQLGIWAKENKFSQAQLNAMFSLKDGVEQYTSEVRNRVYSEGRAELYKEWGDKKDANVAIAESVFAAIPSGQKLAEFIRSSGEGANPVVIRALHEIGNYLQEGGYLKNQDVSNKNNANPMKKRYPTMFPEDKE